MVRRFFLALALAALALPGLAQSADPLSNFTYLASGGNPYNLGDLSIFGTQGGNCFLMSPANGTGNISCRNLSSDADYRVNGLSVVQCKATSTLDAVSSASEFIVFTCLVPGGKLGTSGIARLELMGTILWNNNAADTCRIRIKMGCETNAACTSGQTIFDTGAASQTLWTSINAVRVLYHLDYTIQMRGTNATQVGAGSIGFSTFNAVTVGTGLISQATGNALTNRSFGNMTPTTVSSVTDGYIHVTITWSASSSNNSWRVDAGNVRIDP